MSRMKWCYKTVHFELKREGLLGGSFLDEAEIEEQLNDFGRSGWELISVIEVQDGIIAFFKQSLDPGLSSFSKANVEADSGNLPKADDVYQVHGVRKAEVYEGDEGLETGDVYDNENSQDPNESSVEFEPKGDYLSHLEEEELIDQEEGGHASSVKEDDYDEIVEEAQVEYEDQDGSDEQQDYQNNSGIGAIRIE